MQLHFDTHGNPKQKQAAKAWVDPGISDILYGGAKAGGKSWLGANLVFGDAFIYPETHYFIARDSLSDLRKYTIPTIHKVFKEWKITDKYFNFNGQDNIFKLYNNSKVFLIDAAYQPRDPLFQRFGSIEMTKGWIEEAGEFRVEAKNALAATIGRHLNQKYSLPATLLQTCNPSKNYLYKDYYKQFKAGTLDSWRTFIQAFPEDNKMLDEGYVENLMRTLSKNEKERLIYGNWEYDDDPAALIDYDRILDIFTNTHVEPGYKCITSDIARLGGDRIVIITWNGWRGKIKWYKKQTLDITGALIEEERYKLGIGHSDVLVDEDGMGGGVVDFLKFKGFVNNARAVPSPNSAYNDRGVQEAENFDNIKSQCYFRLADRINKNGLYLECEDSEIRQWVIEELEQVKQKMMDSDLKKGVIPKDKIKDTLGRSPDFADALMMREYFELKPKRTFADADY